MEKNLFRVGSHAHGEIQHLSLGNVKIQFYPTDWPFLKEKLQEALENSEEFDQMSEEEWKRNG